MNKIKKLILPVLVLTLSGGLIFSVYEVFQKADIIYSQQKEIKNLTEENKALIGKVDDLSTQLDELDKRLDEQIKNAEKIVEQADKEKKALEKEVKEKDAIIQQKDNKIAEVEAMKADKKAKEATARTMEASPKAKEETKTLPSEPSGGKVLYMESTAYSSDPADTLGGGTITATGQNLLQNPMAVAVDPNVIPLGTKLYVEGYGEAYAVDTGGAIKGNIVDVHFPTYAQCVQWGRRTVKVTILG